MHVARNRRAYTAKSGEQRVYESVLVRRTYRDGARVRHETLANLSALPADVVSAIEATLKGERLVPAGRAVTITAAAPHGHVAAVHAMAARLGLPALLGPAGRHRDLALALIISRVARPGSKLSTLTWWADTTLGADLGVAGASTDDIYAAMDWLEHRQDAIEARLAARHLAPGANPSKMALFDLSSSWMEGRCCPLAARGYSRDGKKGKLQIEYGLLTDPEGRPVAVRVFPGSTGDPAAFTQIAAVVREKFGLAQMVMVGDRGMITSARIAALNQAEDGTARPDPYGWITALRAPAIRKLMADDGPLQLSLFDEQDLAEITSPDFPGERLIACRNPLLAAERARKREDLLAATEALLAKVASQAQAGRVRGTDKIGVRAGKVINRYKVAKHFILDIGDDHLAWRRDQAAIDAEAALDGIYIIRTPVPATELDTPAAVTAYKNLALVERDFRSLKADDLDLRPIHHWLDDRVRGHVLICMLAAYLTWHLRAALAPLTYTDEQHPARHSPVAPARRSAHADAKAATHASTGGQPLRSFRGLLGHMATLTRSTIALGGHTFEKISDPTPAQRRAFDLIGMPIPLTLTPK